MPDLDHETQAHVDAARRPPASGQPKSFGGEQLEPEQKVGADTDLGAMETASRYVELRRRRDQESLERKLDAMVPLEEIDGPEGKRYRVREQCRECHTPILLESGPEDESEGERPGLKARAVAAGILRRRRHPFLCDECIRRNEEAEERAEAEQKLRGRLETSRLPKAMQGFEFSQMDGSGGRDLTTRAARAWATQAEPDPRGLLIYGNKGAGKTRLAATAAWERLRNWPIRWVAWTSLIGELGAAFDDKARKQAIEVLTGEGALVLDDIARDDVKVSDWEKRQIFTAIDKRIQAGAPLLITTNLTRTQERGSGGEYGGPAAAIGERLGDSIASRLVGYCRVLELPGRDQRLRFNFDGSEKRPAEGEYLADPEEGTDG